MSRRAAGTAVGSSGCRYSCADAAVDAGGDLLCLRQDRRAGPFEPIAKGVDVVDLECQVGRADLVVGRLDRAASRALVLDELEDVAGAAGRAAGDRQLRDRQPRVRDPDELRGVCVVLDLAVAEPQAERIPVEGDRALDVAHAETHVPDGADAHGWRPMTGRG